MLILWGGGVSPSPFTIIINHQLAGNSKTFEMQSWQIFVASLQSGMLSYITFCRISKSVKGSIFLRITRCFQIFDTFYPKIHLNPQFREYILKKLLPRNHIQLLGIKMIFEKIYTPEKRRMYRAPLVKYTLHMHSAQSHT